MTKQEYIDALNGNEIRTALYETELGVVAIENGKIIADGKVIDSNPTKEILSELLSELFYNEFGTYDPKTLII